MEYSAEFVDSLGKYVATSANTRGELDATIASYVNSGCLTLVRIWAIHTVRTFVEISRDDLNASGDPMTFFGER
jgi:hypothetical protein